MRRLTPRFVACISQGVPSRCDVGVVECRRPCRPADGRSQAGRSGSPGAGRRVPCDARGGQVAAELALWPAARATELRQSSPPSRCARRNLPAPALLGVAYAPCLAVPAGRLTRWGPVGKPQRIARRHGVAHRRPVGAAEQRGGAGGSPSPQAADRREGSMRVPRPAALAEPSQPLPCRKQRRGAAQRSRLAATRPGQAAGPAMGHPVPARHDRPQASIKRIAKGAPGEPHGHRHR